MAKTTKQKPVTITDATVASGRDGAPVVTFDGPAPNVGQVANVTLPNGVSYTGAVATIQETGDLTAITFKDGLSVTK